MTVAWAETYAESGWRVFPIWPGEKRPLYSGWQKDATTDPEQIRRYWRKEPLPNIGVVCGERFDAWDIEVQHLEAFTGWMDRNGYTLPEAPVAVTGRGGIHILTEPTGVAGNRYLYLDGTHIGELKSTGGFILICPSVTEHQYQWMWAPESLAVSPAPAWLLGLLERPRTGVHRLPTRITTVEEGLRRLDQLGGAVKGAGEGSRNNYLYWAMRRALDEGVPAKFAAAHLLDVGLSIGLSDHETKATIRSAYEAERAV
jgi:putative DNA primase/helicase